MKKEKDIVQLILNKVQAEAKQEASKPHTIGVYRASEIGGCARALQYATLQYKAEEITPEVHMIFRDGHIHHHAVRELLGKTGTMSNIEMTISKQYKHKGSKFTITGTIDGVWNGMVFDVKSISTFRFKYLDKNFPQDYTNYVDQIMIYMDILKLTKSFFIFKDKNSAELKVIYVDFNQKAMDAILDRIVEIHKGAKLNKLMPRPFERTDWHCKLCAYRLHCWKLPMEARHWGSQAREAAKDQRQRQTIAKLRAEAKG